MWPGGSPTAVNSAAGLIIVAMIIAALYVGRDLLIPFAFAGLLSLVLSPLLRRLIGWGLPRGPAVALIVVVVIAALTGVVTLAGRQVAQLVEEVPRYEQTLREKARFVHSWVGGPGIWQRALDTLRNVAEEVRDPGTESKPVQIEVAQNSAQPITVVLDYFRSALPPIETAVLAVLFTMFILLQYADLRDRVVRIMGVREIGRSTQALSEAGSDLGRYFLLQASVNAAFGTFVSVALLAIGIPSPGLWGALTAIMRFMPYIGSLLAAVFPIALAAMVDPGWWRVAETAAVFAIGEPVVGQILEPLLFGTHTRLSPIAVLTAAAFWTLLWGPVGLILAMPLTLAAVVMSEHLPHLEFLGVLLGNEPVLAPPEHLYRQLLAGDVAEAARDFDDLLEEGDFVKHLDEAAIPALRLASQDHRRGVLESSQVVKLKQTLDDYVSQLRELLDFRSEQHMQSKVTPAGHTQTADATALIIAGRGVIDEAAAELLAEALRVQLGIAVQCPAPGGLTGIAAAAQAVHNREPDFVVLVSVGEATPTQFNLLLSRITRVFHGSVIIVGDWAGRPPPTAQRVTDIPHPESIGAVVDTMSRLAAERDTNSEAALEAV